MDNDLEEFHQNQKEKLEPKDKDSESETTPKITENQEEDGQNEENNSKLPYITNTSNKDYDEINNLIYKNNLIVFDIHSNKYDFFDNKKS